MGELNLPESSLVYLDTQIIIYSIEKHPTYWSLLRSLWQRSAIADIQLISSELALLETLVAPLKNADVVLVNAYERLLLSTEMQLMPITRAILKDAAKMRSQTNLKTPDAIHAATAIAHSCNIFLTNDYGFRRVTSLPLVILSDIAAS
ncbi:MAG: PIN domain-containing protein [Symploca sp. SIO2C1]|nr:PIN domain-containing protein [Symploca sp. SIO2C1]